MPFCQRRQFLMNCLIPRYSNPFLFRGYVSRSPPLARAPLLGVVVAAMSPRTLAYHARNHLPTYTCARPLPRPLCEHTAAAHAAQLPTPRSTAVTCTQPTAGPPQAPRSGAGTLGQQQQRRSNYCRRCPPVWVYLNLQDGGLLRGNLASQRLHELDDRIRHLVRRAALIRDHHAIVISIDHDLRPAA